MKNIVYAVGALIVIIVLIFIFASKKTAQNDTIIPSPIPIEDEQMKILTNLGLSSNEIGNLLGLRGDYIRRLRSVKRRNTKIGKGV